MNNIPRRISSNQNGEIVTMRRMSFLQSKGLSLSSRNCFSLLMNSSSSASSRIAASSEMSRLLPREEPAETLEALVWRFDPFLLGFLDELGPVAPWIEWLRLCRLILILEPWDGDVRSDATVVWRFVSSANAAATGGRISGSCPLLRNSAIVNQSTRF